MAGCGYWSPNIVRNLASMESADLVALCDIDENLARGLADRFAPDTSVLTDVKQVCDDPLIEAVFVATPVRTHFALARDLLLAGKHVFVEKPLAQRAVECEELGDLADRQNLRLMVGHVFEYSAPVQLAKRYLAEGVLGRPLYGYAQFVNLGRIQHDIGALWSFAPHEVSIFNSWLGSEPVSVSAQGIRCLGHEVEDVVFVLLEYPGRIPVHLHLSWIDPQKIRQWTLVATRKMLVYDDVSQNAPIRIYDKGVTDLDDYLRDPAAFPKFPYQMRVGQVETPQMDLPEPLRIECEHFMECVRTGSRPKTDAMSGLRVVRVLEAAQRSLEKGGATVSI